MSKSNKTSLEKAWNLILQAKAARRHKISERVEREKKKLKPHTIADNYPIDFISP